MYVSKPPPMNMNMNMNMGVCVCMCMNHCEVKYKKLNIGYFFGFTESKVDIRRTNEN